MMAANPLVPPAAAYQSLDGTGNNLVQVEWGSTNEQLLRMSPVAYADGISAPSGADRPNAREVSNLLAASPADGIVNDRDWTAFVYAWGQFLDHDLGLTTAASPSEKFPIQVPTGDPSFDPNGTGMMTIPMSRSTWDAMTGTGIDNPRQQVNTLSAYIDGSQVYGSEATRAAALREFVGGRMRTSDGNLLPYNTAGLANDNDAHRVADTDLFLAGDVRVNENPELLALQTLFVREHNRLAGVAAKAHPNWTDEQLYQYARRMVISEIQKITYDEFLPALLGSAKSGANGIAPYSGYRPDVNAGLATEFSTAAYRIGHSMLGADIEFLDNNGNEVHDAMELRDAFFDPRPVAEWGIDSIVKYLASDRAQEIDTRVIDDVRNFLFGMPGQGGFDLASLNIQRGRDHGLADYNRVLEAYGLPRVNSFAEITPDVTVQQALEEAYGSVDRIDLWVGGLAEKHLAGSSLGETFTRIIADQFTRLRDGDRFWYQNALPPRDLKTIQATSLADVLRRNTQVTNLQPRVFFFKTSISGSVFADANRDGIRQSREQALANVAVRLVDATGEVVAETRTNAAGAYVFKGMNLGTFRVVAGNEPDNRPAAERAVAITRGGDVRAVNLGVPPKAVAPKPAQLPRPAPLPQAAVFASLAVSMAPTTTVGTLPKKK